MLAYDFIRTQAEYFQIIGVDRSECDVTSLESIQKCLDAYKPDVVLNCAAYTRVDDAEDIWANENFLVNAMWPYYLAKATYERGIWLITISTDYVFDGEKWSLYTPEDTPNPINAYGRAKWLWEKLALQENPRSIVVRTSWLYGGWPQHKNFVKTILRLAKEKDEIKVVNDQVGLPTYTIDLSNALKSLISDTNLYNARVLHLCGASVMSTTWYDFATEIVALTVSSVQVKSCSTTEYLTKAKRPQKSELLNSSSYLLPDWRIGISHFIKNSQ